MKHSKDIIRVLRGVNLVVDQLLAQQKQNSPELTRRIRRVSDHASQVLQTILEYQQQGNKSEYSSNNPQGSYVSTEGSSQSPQSPVDAAAVYAQTVASMKTKTDESLSDIHGDIKLDKDLGNSSTLPPSGLGAIGDTKDASSGNGNNTAKKSVTSNVSQETEKQSMKSATIDLVGFPEPEPSTTSTDFDTNVSQTKANMRARAVPSSQLSRMWGFGTLAAQIAFGVVTENATRIIDGSQSKGISDRNAEVLAEALCRMRGAALKLGQMLSLHDEGTMPPALVKALERVRQGADYMPKHQLEQQLASQLGSDWRGLFSDFDEVPIAAASIGQVHKGTLIDGTKVAIKIQYPGVADSIESDLQNLKRLVSMANVLPPGLFIDQIMRVAQVELAEECNYTLEGSYQSRYRELVLNDPILRKHVYVPKVYHEISTERVLVTELVPGVSIEKAANLPQEVRNAIARTSLIISIRELFEWRLVQSDPNYGNFLYHNPSRTINMIDFGATREYSKKFIDGYLQLVWSAANRDRDALIEVSKTLGFLTGDESPEMLHAHAETGLVVGEPFLSNEPYDFAASNLSTRISQYGGTFMKYRLTAPPVETYSLHRKLAGAFLLCIRLKAKIKCRDILEDTYKAYKFD